MALLYCRTLEEIVEKFRCKNMFQKRPHHERHGFFLLVTSKQIRHQHAEGYAMICGKGLLPKPLYYGLNLALRELVVALVTRIVMQVQIAIIYLNASLAKEKVLEWVDGTALYYWYSSNYTGMPHYMLHLFDAVLLSPWIVLWTWSVLVLEFFLEIAKFLNDGIRRILLIFGLVFMFVLR